MIGSALLVVLFMQAAYIFYENLEQRYRLEKMERLLLHWGLGLVCLAAMSTLCRNYGLIPQEAAEFNLVLMRLGAVLVLQCFVQVFGRMRYKNN